MKKKKLIWMVAAGLMLGLSACDKDKVPDASGTFLLSSQTFGESYFIYGYSYQESELTRHPFPGDAVPDIINEGFRVIVDGATHSVPGFTTPEFVNGFVLLGSFEAAGEARTFFNGYHSVGEGLVFSPVSDTVRLHQVWLQKTAAGHYAKLLVTQVRELSSEGGAMNSEVEVEFRYQADGSGTFPE